MIWAFKPLSNSASGAVRINLAGLKVEVDEQRKETT